MATYYVNGGTGGTDAGTSWANAAESIAGLMTAQAIAGGDIILVHKTHAFNAGGAITWTLPETGAGIVKVICVDKDASDAPSTGAVETTGGNFAFTITTASNVDAALYVQGMTMRAGAGASSASADITLQASNHGRLAFNGCTFDVNSTNTGAVLSMGGSAAMMQCSFTNCTFQAANASSWNVNNGIYDFVNCSLAGTSPTTVFAPVNARTSVIRMSGCNFSGATNVITLANQNSGSLFASNCAITTPTTGTHVGYGGIRVEFQACGPADGVNGADILNYYYEDRVGIVQDSQSVYKATAGAQGEQDDGTDTSYSLSLDTNSGVSTAFPLYTPWIYTLVTSTGAKTVTLKCAHTEAAVLTDTDLFMEVEYMGEPGATGTKRLANSPHSQVEVDDACDVVSGTIIRDAYVAGSNRTDDAADDWTGIASEIEHTLTASVTLDEVGYIRCRVGLTKNTTSVVYVDPKIGVA